MKLTETKKALSTLLENQTFGDYAVLVNYDGEEIFLSSEKVDRYSYFDVASMGKVLITTTLILRAVGENKISLQSRLPEFFSDVPAALQNVTVQHLLTHTSGIVRFEFPNTAKNYDREQLAAMILSNPPAFAPETNMQYSCNGFILLGMIAEKVWGDSFENLFERFIREPLGLVRSCCRIDVDEPNAVIGYNRENHQGQRFDDHNVRIMDRAVGSGGQFWCVQDIDTFLSAVVNRDSRLYHPSLFSVAEQDYTPNYAEGRGLGWLYVDSRYPQTGRLFEEGSFGHCGHTGMSMFISKSRRLRVIIATNATRYANIKNQFHGYDYGHTMKMREIVHNAIYDDLFR